MNDTKTNYSKVTLCDDGKYRWVYEVNLFKNPTFFFLIWKIFFFIFLAIFAFVNIVDIINWGFGKMVQNLPFLGYFLLGMTAVVGLGYLIYAAIMGGKYIVEFEMDEKGFVHRQIASQAKKAKKIGRATMLAGVTSGRLSTIGAGASAQRTDMYTEFSKVKKVRSYPRSHTIKVKESFEHNQIYASNEDFPFVLEYIVAHCPSIKK